MALSRSFKHFALTLRPNGILRVALDRPKVNAMSSELLVEMKQVFEAATEDSAVRGIIVASNQKAFSAGLDLNQVYELGSSGDRDAIGKFGYETLVEAFAGPVICPKPVACAVQGHAIAGGMILALASDFLALSNQHDYFLGVTEHRVGVPFPRLPLDLIKTQLNPVSRRFFIQTGDIVPAKKAFELGCGDVFVPNTEESCEKWLNNVLSTTPAETFRIAKEHYWEDVTEPLYNKKDQTRETWIDMISSKQALSLMEKTLKK
eukprot:TRINITY_DN2526_c0_g1_i1.p1 TRINITY_DN2526_c0_g1~~TRINITY_DN2526_c0_g1_i1.p1  ORF type:complete len:271 (-),score=52.68 TRINITY_DN2526_c0_g1_i1:541-1326(-)